jgi:transcriptional regulator with XRE-family HTH domain
MEHAIVARFGRNLKAARKRAGLTQEEVNWRSGVHPTELSKMEHGRRDVHISTLARLARTLGVSPGELLDGISDEPPAPE